MHWAAHYIGIPFRVLGRTREGVDCWGLVRLVLEEQFGRQVPSFELYASTDPERVAPVIQACEHMFARVPSGSEAPGDVVLMRVGRLPVHTGVVVDAGRMLHVQRGIEACVERYDGMAWRDRVVGFYRAG